jgi:uncharacterized protein DUF5989
VDPSQQPSAELSSGFAREAERAAPGLLRELAAFLRENKKWWLVPVVVALVLVAALVLLGGTAAAPFIYTLF